jgi:hypothetical protein
LNALVGHKNFKVLFQCVNQRTTQQEELF